VIPVETSAGGTEEYHPFISGFVIHVVVSEVTALVGIHGQRRLVCVLSLATVLSIKCTECYAAILENVYLWRFFICLDA
jgi:hypothetical protein